MSMDSQSILETQMKAVLKVVAVLFVAIAAFLIYAIVAAVTSDEGARVGICILYAVIAGVLSFSAMKLWTWRRGAAPQSVNA
jgi:hypothetical protein